MAPFLFHFFVYFVTSAKKTPQDVEERPRVSRLVPKDRRLEELTKVSEGLEEEGSRETLVDVFGGRYRYPTTVGIVGHPPPFFLVN